MIKLTPEKLVFLFFLVFFIFVPNNDQGYDSYAFLLDARDGQEIVHPHHLLYNVLKYILYLLSTRLGLDAMKVISLVSSVIGAFSLALIFRFIRQRALPEIALTGTMIIGMVFSFWYYSTTVEVNIVSIMFLALTLYYLLNERSDRNSILAFLFLTIGILFHQLLILALIPMLIYDSYRHGFLKRSIRLSMLSLIPGFVIYIIVALAASDNGIAGAYAWLAKYPGLGRWGVVHSGSVIASFGGIAKAVFGGSMLRQALYGGGISLPEILYVVGTMLSLCGMSILFINAAKSMLKKADSILLGVTAFIFLIFAFWWAPQDGGFWFYPVVLILIIVFSSVGNSGFIRNTVYATMIIFALVNITCAFVPASRINNSVSRTGADALAKLALARDDLLVSNMPQIRLALDYHYNVRPRIKSVAYLEDGPKNEMIEKYRSTLSDFEGRVIIFENEIHPESHRRFLFGRFSKKEYTETYRPFLSSLVAVDSIRVYGEWVAIYELEKDDEPE
ncbi:MAG: glycosyltransferase family 39 protein [Candidatus Zixiibacteriota bacterium]|nr:MAG: glycosyltransferase family 39 protein [candidate division Zixibacteria bacterium]